MNLEDLDTVIKYFFIKLCVFGTTFSLGCKLTV